jgi:hypothetical protein
MKGYVYQAAWICTPCGKEVMDKLETPAGYPDEYTWDTDWYPKGPYWIGESDSPEHCDICNLFLENPLPDDRLWYVAEYDKPEWNEFYKAAIADYARRVEIGMTSVWSLE